MWMARASGAASAGTGGAISPSGNTIVAPGVNQAYAITPNAGYLVGSVLVDGVSVGTVTAYTFSNVSAGHTIAVTFAPTNPPSSYPMALGNYSEGFDDIANWADNFAAGVGASYWGSVPVTATGTIPDGVKTTASSATFLVNTSFSSSVQRGTGALWMLSTGTTDNSSAIAVDLRLDFTGVTAGTLSFDWAQINNSTGNRTGSVRVYTSTDGVTYTNLSSANVLNVANNTGATGRIASVALPSSFSNNANARLRFYYSNGSGGSSGSRPKIAIDNVAVTGTPIPVNYTITASAGAGGSITPSGAVSVTGGQNKSFAIAANVGSHIAGVQVDGVFVGAVSAYTFSNVTANHTIAASFAADAWTLDVGITGSGAVTRSPDLATYPSGTLVQLTASPEAGFAFAGWSGDTTAFVNPLPLAMRSNRTLLASFVDVAAPVVKVTSPNGGEVWAAGSLHAITWTASDNVGVDSVTVQVSTRGIGGPWTTVQSGAANSGSLAWTVPAQSTDSLVARVLAYDHALNVGSDVSDSLARVPSSTTAVGPGGPAVLRLARPWPNPSAGPATVEFSLPARGRATLEVLDVEGRRVTALEGQFEAGSHVWTWDGRHHGSNESHAGLYFVRLVTPWGKRMERLVRL
mgnify:CR=1 FL=1